MKKLATIFTFIPTLLFAQVPAKDVSCSTINVPVVSAANCVSTTICQWANASFSTGGTSNPACGGFGNTTKDVWCKFTTINNNCAILLDKAYSVSVVLISILSNCSKH